MLDKGEHHEPTPRSVLVGGLVHVDRIDREHLRKQQDQSAVSRGQNMSAMVRLSLISFTTEARMYYIP